MPENNEFKGEIIVASRIVDYLSSGLYQSPSACLKELINNSFDADATHVDVYVKPDADRIIIDDNGHGMDKADFQKHFSKISESFKREDSEYTALGRPKIGKIGIGFIAANEICDVMEIISTKEGSDELLEVTIDFALMRKDYNERKRSESEFAKADYVGITNKTDKESHYTKIFLRKKVRGEAKSILAGVGTSSYSSGKKTLYGKKPEAIYKQLKLSNLSTWSDFDDYSKNMLEIGLNVPVKYHDAWMPKRLISYVKPIEDYVSKLNFSLNIDGTQIKKPIVFSPEDKKGCFISKFEFVGDYVGANGYFYAQNKTIRPQELQGLLIRIRNSAVGGYDPRFMGYSLSRGNLFQAWISAEIMADDRLEDAMNIDRRTLRIAHPAYVELQRAIHEHLEEVIKRVREEIYKKGSTERKVDKASEIKQMIFDIASEELSGFAPDAAKLIRNTWKNSEQDLPLQKKLLRKYTVNELYEIVIEVAKDVLPAAQVDKFITKLTERLGK